MNKWLTFIVFFLLEVSFSFAGDASPTSGQEVLKALNNFNPNQLIKGYTENPTEAALRPGEGSKSLEDEGVRKLNNNKTAKELYDRAHTRARVKQNIHSPESIYAERLLQQPEGVLNGDCYKKPAECTPISSKKMCFDEITYHSLHCKDKLNVAIKTEQKKLRRAISTSRYKRAFKLDISRCLPGDKQCSFADTIKITNRCENLVVSVSSNRHQVFVRKMPTCQDSTLEVIINGFFPFGVKTTLDIEVTEQWSEDAWDNSDCQEKAHDFGSQSCTLISTNACLSPNTTRVISGFPVKRSCWGSEKHYQCKDAVKGNCDGLISSGCSQVASSCVESSNNLCHKFQQTFECYSKYCVPEKTICPEKIACADGACDSTQKEESNDIRECNLICVLMLLYGILLFQYVAHKYHSSHCYS